jgi:iron(III) transport system ATP-binding protein
MVLEPRVLLFDEPLSNLDARLRRRVRDEIRTLQQTLGLTVVYVTHDQSEALAISDRIIVMNHARIAQDGTPRGLYEAPADRFVVNFMGEASILPVEISGIEGDTAAVRLGDVVLALPARGLRPGLASLAIRPHAVHLSPVSGMSAMPRGTVRRAVYGGDHMEYEVMMAGFAEMIFVVDTRVSVPFAVDTAVDLAFSVAGLSLLPAASP